MVNSETIKYSLSGIDISNLIFDPSILFINTDDITDLEQREKLVINLINFMNLIDEYNLNLYWNADLQQDFYQYYYHFIIGYRPQILTSFFQKLFPKLNLIKTEGYNQCVIIPNLEFCEDLSSCYSSFQKLAHFLIHNKSFIGYFLGIFQDRDNYSFSCKDCGDNLSLNPFLIKDERDVYNFLFNFLLVYFFPLKDDELAIKDQKIKLILNLCIFIGNNFEEIEKEYEFNGDFWASEFLYCEDILFKTKTIEVICHIILNPNTALFRKHKLNHEYIVINGRRNSIIQFDIFQEYRLSGIDITPRLLVTFFQNKIIFHKILDRH